MSIIKSNFASIEEPFTLEWLEQQGIYEKTLPITKRYIYDKIPRIEKVSVYEHFNCDRHWSSDGREYIEIYTSRKRLWREYFEPSHLTNKKQVLEFLSRIEKAKYLHEHRKNK